MCVCVLLSKSGVECNDNDKHVRKRDGLPYPDRVIKFERGVCVVCTCVGFGNELGFGGGGGGILV